MKYLLIVLFIFPGVLWAEGSENLDGATIVDSESAMPELEDNTLESDLDGIEDGNIGDTNFSPNSIQMGAAQGAIKGAKKATDTGVKGVALTGVLTGICLSSWGFSSYACTGAVMAAGGSVLAFQQARKLNKHANKLLTQSGQSRLDLDDPILEDGMAAASAHMNQLTAQGYVSNDDGSVTGPDGKSLSPGDFQSSAALQKKGVPAADADQILAKIAEAKNKLAAMPADEVRRKVASVATANGAGGQAGSAGFGSGGAGGQGEITGGLTDGEESAGKKPKRLTASEANGYNTNFLGTRIGIAGGSLFGIVHKKYQKNSKKNTFFNREY